MKESIGVKILTFRMNDVANLTGKEIGLDDVFPAYYDSESSCCEVFIKGQSFKIQKHWLQKVNEDHTLEPLAVNPKIDSSRIE